MVRINGVKATSTQQLEKEKKLKPTLNQILDKMENNYQEINNPQNVKTNLLYNNSNYINKESQNQSNENSSNDFSNQNANAFTNNIFSNLLQNSFKQNDAKNDNYVSTQNFAYDKSNLLLSVLPMILSKNKDKGGMKNSQEVIMKELIKQTNNPRLAQIVELLPKILNKNNNFGQVFTSSQTQKKEEPKIDSFKKTSEYTDD